MAMPSVLLCNGCTPWQRLLFTASLLACWHFSTSTAQVTIESVPPQVVEGENVLFLVHNLPENLIASVWFRGLKITENVIAIYDLKQDFSAPGPIHSGRETVYRNGSLLLRNVTMKDTGRYTLRTINRHGDIVSTTIMNLHVHNSSIDNGVRMVCSNGSLVVQVVTEKDAGMYILEAFNEYFKMKKLKWYSIHGILTATAKKHILYNPAPVWTLGDTRELLDKEESQGTKGAKNEEAASQDSSVISGVQPRESFFIEHVMQPFLEISDATVAVEKSVSLICISPHDDNSFHWLFNNQSLQLTDRMTLTVTKRVLRIDPVRIEDAGDYQCEVSNPVSSKTSLPVRLAVVKG
ncbi:carcinoembryonic antigen-related cell adhesion molecule 3 isoform X1 [Cricetulus griseus]|uniref:carcinoembryonic antigen-related cell adhesion molecule 3 isoform X1 n=1 Tax=Cricetulus griseus TaxID=10029 RepID=UPI0007DA951F|nr:carcinoembryonic antigen-related cell adhesion molecule 3 isoform X1 [Cricetulus griseus]